MHRPLVRRDAVRVAFLQAEAVAAVLQHHARAFGQDAAAEALEQRVDERAGVALAVHHAEVHRVAVARVVGGAGRRQGGHGARVVDEAAQLGEVGGVGQARNRYVRLRGVGEEGVAVAVGQPRRFHVAVQPLGR